MNVKSLCIFHSCPYQSYFVDRHLGCFYYWWVVVKFGRGTDEGRGVGLRLDGWDFDGNMTVGVCREIWPLRRQRKEVTYTWEGGWSLVLLFWKCVNKFILVTRIARVCLVISYPTHSWIWPLDFFCFLDFPMLFDINSQIEYYSNINFLKRQFLIYI